MAKEVIGKGWITVAAINDGKPGSPGSPGSPGKPGSDGKDALTVSVSPEVIVLHAVKVSDSNYNVTNFSTAQARIAVFRGGTNVSPQCALSDVKQQYCRAAASDLTISITSVSQNVVDGMRIPYTDARVTATVNYVENGNIERLYVTIGVKVEVSALWGRVEKNLSGLSSKYLELSNTVNGLPLKDDAALTKYTSEIKQSAQSISAKVAQETVGRLNLLPGTAFNRETDVEQLNNYFPCKFEPLGGLEGTGAMVASQTGATTLTWCGVKWKGIVLKPSTWYTISVWARTDSGLDDVMYLDLRQDGADAMSHQFLGKAGETHEWQLFSHTFKTASTAESCNNVTVEMGMHKNGVGRCCKLMLDESKTYNGWTAASYADVSSRALEATGIDIKHKTIDLTADKFTLRNNHGEKSFGVDEDGNLEARSLKSVSKDGLLTAVIKDGAFTALSGLSGATAFFGLIDGLPYLQFTNAAGVVCYAIGPSGGQTTGNVGVQMVACGVKYSVTTVSPSGGKSSYLIGYSGSVTLQNFGSESAKIYQSKLQLVIDGFTQMLTAGFKDESFPLTEVGQGKVATIMPGKLMQMEFKMNLVAESMSTTGSDGSMIAKPSGARSCKLKLNGEVIGKGAIN